MILNVMGVIISTDDQWIYDWYELEATSPKKINDLIAKAKKGEEKLKNLENEKKEKEINNEINLAKAKLNLNII